MHRFLNDMVSDFYRIRVSQDKISGIANSHISVIRSFPTRRSSDLVPRGLPNRWDIASTRSNSRSPAKRGLPVTGCRSEEHTSELQSRLQLVCRLLLEKKKNRTKKCGMVNLTLILNTRESSLINTNL